MMAKFIPLILFTVLTNAAAQILLKNGMLRLGTFEFSATGIVSAVPQIVFNPFVLIGLFTFVVSMSSHLLVLSRVDISFAFPFLSLAYVVVALYSYFVFGETMNLYRISGIAVICLGTFLISRS
jgi:drug/metabolite transporter (DMT)-like permease